MKNLLIIDLLDTFIPAVIRNNHDLSQQELIRVRAMLAILGFSIVVPVLLLIIYVALQFLTDNDFSRNVYILMLVETVLMSQHIYFQSYGNLRITAGAYSLQFLLVIAVFALISGALQSPLIPLLICAPMIAYMTMGLRAGLLHIAAVLLVIVGFLLMQIKEISYLDIGYKANYPYTLTIACGVTLLILAMFLVIFEELVRNKNGTASKLPP